MALYIPGMAEYPTCKEKFKLAEELLKDPEGNRNDLSEILTTLDDNPHAVRFLEAEFGKRYGEVYDQLRTISLFSDTKQPLETITGNLLAYKELVPGTFQHSDQLTTERDNHVLRNEVFYTADGNLYTVQKGECLWAITREPQNLVLQNIDEAYRQLTEHGNYFPDANAARVSLYHKHTVVVELKWLDLVKSIDRYGYFVVDPKNINKLNSEQEIVAQRIYGPDEENFRLNMEIFAKAAIIPCVFALMPDYVQGTLRSNDKEFIGRASRLNYFDASFFAFGRDVRSLGVLRGVNFLRRRCKKL